MPRLMKQKIRKIQRHNKPRLTPPNQNKKQSNAARKSSHLFPRNQIPPRFIHPPSLSALNQRTQATFGVPASAGKAHSTNAAPEFRASVLECGVFTPLLNPLGIIPNASPPSESKSAAKQKQRQYPPNTPPETYEPSSCEPSPNSFQLQRRYFPSRK